MSKISLTTSLSSSIFDAKEFMWSFPIITLLTMLTVIFLSFEIQFCRWVRNDYHLYFSFITMILTHTRRKSYKFHIVYLFFQNIQNMHIAIFLYFKNFLSCYHYSRKLEKLLKNSSKRGFKKWFDEYNKGQTTKRVVEFVYHSCSEIRRK